MIKISFFDTKPYDRDSFNSIIDKYDMEIHYHETKLNPKTAILAEGTEVVCAFVNDDISEKTIDKLYEIGVKLIIMRCAGYNNVDIKAAFNKIHIMRVPAYSPYAVAEFSMGLLLTLNRKIHRAYNRTREYNFSINGLTGFDLRGKTIGIVGTGKIGQAFIHICKGFGLNIVAYDLFPNKDLGVRYVEFDDLCRESDIISLHCPLTKDTHHIINKESMSKMKDGVIIINTSRGALIHSEELLEGIKSGKISAAGLDVYEEESEVFFEDYSNTVIQDDILARLVTLPNVIVTSHQAFLTRDALFNIAETSLNNVLDYVNGKSLKNEICYRCSKFGECQKEHIEKCF